MKNIFKKILKGIAPLALVAVLFTGVAQAANIFSVQQGGTGANTLTGIVRGNGTTPFTTIADGGSGDVLTTNGSGVYSFSTPAALPSLGTNQFYIGSSGVPVDGGVDATFDPVGQEFIIGDQQHINLGGELDVHGGNGIMRFSSKVNGLYGSQLLNLSNASDTGFSTQIGDLTSAISADTLNLNISGLNDLSANELDVIDGNLNHFFQIDRTNNTYSLGDIDAAFNKTSLNINDSNHVASFFGANSIGTGGATLNLDSLNGIYAIGDINGNIGNGTFASVEDGNQLYRVGGLLNSVPLSDMLHLDFSSGIASMGDLFGSENSMRTTVDDANETFFAGHTGVGSGKLLIDVLGESTTLTAGDDAGTSSHPLNFVLDANAGEVATGDTSGNNYFDITQKNALYGINAGQSLAGGKNNFMGGNGAGTSQATGNRSTFLGDTAGSSFDGNDSIFIGSASASSFTGSNALFIGTSSGAGYTTNTGDTVIGNSADGSGDKQTIIGSAVTAGTGEATTLLGYQTGNSGITGIGNTAVGATSAHSITSGHHNTLLGFNTDVPSGTRSYGIALGAYAITGTNVLAIGGDDANNVNGNGWIDQVIIGGGSQNTVAHDLNIEATSITPSVGVSDTRGAQMTLQPGAGVGNKLSGDLVFQASTTHASGQTGGAGIDANRFNGNSGQTTSATPLVVPLIYPDSEGVYTVEAEVVARRISGSAGTAGDSAGYKLVASFKTIGGTLTQIGTTVQTPFDTDQPLWDATFSVTGNVINAVFTGATNNNVNWKISTQFTRLVL